MQHIMKYGYLGTLGLIIGIASAAVGDSFHQRFPDSRLEPLYYNHPGLVVDLGVGQSNALRF